MWLRWLILLAAPIVRGQLPLPSPAYLPPPASFGAQQSSSSGVPNKQWATLLGNAIWFYDAQRSGTLGSSNRVSWRNDSALSDGHPESLDLTGGYYDSGSEFKSTI